METCAYTRATAHTHASPPMQPAASTLFFFHSIWTIPWTKEYYITITVTHFSAASSLLVARATFHHIYVAFIYIYIFIPFFRVLFRVWCVLVFSHLYNCETKIKFEDEWMNERARKRNEERESLVHAGWCRFVAQNVIKSNGQQPSVWWRPTANRYLRA